LEVNSIFHLCPADLVYVYSYFGDLGFVIVGHAKVVGAKVHRQALKNESW
jgi:hypothetical protein